MGGGKNRGRIELRPVGTTPHLAFAARLDPDIDRARLVCEAHVDHLRGWLVRNDDGEWCLLASAGGKWTERPLVAHKVLKAAEAAGIILP